MRPLIAVPATLLLVIRAYTRKSLTTTGILCATATAIVHALHPSPLPFTLLAVFFLLGTTATKVKHNIKATLTLSSSGTSGGEGSRTSIQVLANSGIASLLCLGHVVRYGLESSSSSSSSSSSAGWGSCFGDGGVKDLVLIGIVSNYAAVTADTLSSELGILSKSRPRLITTLKSVPPGTNGGVTLAGVLAGAAGSAIIGFVSVLLLDFCGMGSKLGLWMAVTIWGTLGSLLDSLLGAILQASVIDRRTGKVVEGAGGNKVLIESKKKSRQEDEKTKGLSRSIGSGRDILDNNQINALMALSMTVGGMLLGGGSTSFQA